MKCGYPYGYPYNGILVSNTKNEVGIHVTVWMNLKNIVPIESNQISFT